MPLGEIASGFLEIIGRIFMELILEILIKGPGYLIVKIFTKKNINPDSFLVIVIGLIVWVIFGYGVFLVYSIAKGN